MLVMAWPKNFAGKGSLLDQIIWKDWACLNSRWGYFSGKLSANVHWALPKDTLLHNIVTPSPIGWANSQKPPSPSQHSSGTPPTSTVIGIWSGECWYILQHKCVKPQHRRLLPNQPATRSANVRTTTNHVSQQHIDGLVQERRNSIANSVRTRNFQARALGDFHDRVSRAARAWGHKFSSEAMRVYMGENRFSLWSYHIGTVFKSIQLSFDIYRVSNHHLVHDIHQMVGGLHNLYKFQWSITSCLSYVKYWPENIKTCLPPCGG